MDGGCTAFNLLHVDKILPVSSGGGRFDLLGGEFGSVGVDEFEQEITVTTFSFLFNVLLQAACLVCTIDSTMKFSG